MSLRLDLQLQRPDFELRVTAEIGGRGVTALCGPSGCGKTTLLRCIAGLERDVRGSVAFDGATWLDGRRALPAEKRGIGFVFQEARLFPHLSVRDNLLFARRRRFAGTGPGIAEVSGWLGLERLLARPVQGLSGGEQKRVAIARALLLAPRLMLMDEPLAGLHDSARRELLTLLEGLPEHLRSPIVYVSHSFAEVSRLADRVLLMEDGRITRDGSVMALSCDLDSPLTHRADAAAVLTGTVADRDEEFELSYVRLGPGTGLWLSQLSLPPGAAVRLQLPARDISIALEPPAYSSILNILPCRIEEIERTEAAQVLLRLSAGGQTLLARITRKSLHRLGLRAGQSVFAQIKSVSLLSERVGVPA